MKKFLIVVINFLFYCSLLATPKKDLQPLTVVLDWFVNPQHAPIIIAQEKGFFKHHGLKVNIIAPADPNDPPKLVTAGKADIAIGYSMSGLGSSILGAMLKYNGVKLHMVKLVDVHYNLVQALLSTRVAAISGGQRNFEVPELELAKRKIRVFYPEKNGIPKFDALIFLANRNELQDARLLAFMRSIQEAVQYVKQQPHTSWQLLLKHHPELNNALNKRAWKLTLPYFDNHPLYLNKKRYNSFAKWMLQHKLIHKIPPLRYYAINLNDYK